VPTFHLSFQTSPSDAPIHIEIDAVDDAGARSAAVAHIAECFGHSGMPVLLHPSGRFQLGAGFWVRTGMCRLTAEPTSSELDEQR